MTDCRCPIEMAPTLRTPLILLAILLAMGAESTAQRFTAPFSRQLRIPTSGAVIKRAAAVHADPSANEVFVSDQSGSKLVIFGPDRFFRFSIIGGSTFRTPIDLAVDPDGFILLLAVFEGRKGLAWLDFDGKMIERLEWADLPEEVAEPDLVSVALTPAGDYFYALDKANRRIWAAQRDGTILDSVDLTGGLDPDEIEDLVFGKIDIYDDTLLLPISSFQYVQLFDLELEPLEKVGQPGSGACKLAFPVAAAMAEDDRVIILDRMRFMFLVYERSGRCLGEFSGVGNRPGRLYAPQDLTLDGEGRIYIGQGLEGRVQEFHGSSPAARVSVPPDP